MKYTKSFCFEKYKNKRTRVFFESVCKFFYKKFNCCNGPMFIWNIGSPDGSGDGVFTMGLKYFPKGTTFFLDIFQSEPETPPDLPANTIPASFANLGLVGTIGPLPYSDNTPASSPLSGNDFARFTVTTPGGSVYIIWWFFHFEAIIEGEPIMQSQVSFNNGSTWMQTNGFAGAIKIPFNIY